MGGISGIRPFASGRLIWFALAAFLVNGCGPSDLGTIDLSKSKAIAAEKGLDEKRGAPKKAGGKARATSVEPGRDGSRN